MLPYIVIVAAIVFFVLKRSGLFEELQGRDRKAPRTWRKSRPQSVEQDPELNNRLEVFKDFFDNQADEEE